LIKKNHEHKLNWGLTSCIPHLPHNACEAAPLQGAYAGEGGRDAPAGAGRSSTKALGLHEFPRDLVP
jgi:hypothetical protein